jgi:transposase
MVQLTDKQKYEIVILREQNYKINDIADKMKINRKTVMLWINTYAKNKNVRRKEGSGNSRITTIDDDDIILDIIRNDDEKTLTEIKNLLEEQNIFVSITTIYRRLIENEYSYKFPIKKPFLTDDHKKKD